MLERLRMGEVPDKPHTAMRGPKGVLRYEECFTRRGFDGPYTMLYHERRPHLSNPREGAVASFPIARGVEAGTLTRRHFQSDDVESSGSPLEARRPLLFNADVVLSVLTPTTSDRVYFANNDADDLYFVREGGAKLVTQLGELQIDAHDYVIVPRGLLHRFEVTAQKQRWLSVECLGGIDVPKQYRNDWGQLKMDAPYSHRDFRAPTFVGPKDEGIRDVVVKKGNRFFGHTLAHSPLDVIGWDGATYPVVFPISRFSPRTGQVHLPPTVHGTFAARGALVCSFVPRMLDFGKDAIPCPYPHSSVDVDEVLYYCDGNFSSRKGVGPGSISFHPAGIPHGPHEGAYEGSIGHTRTEELAVMLDCFLPLQVTDLALGSEDAAYHRSF